MLRVGGTFEEIWGLYRAIGTLEGGVLGTFWKPPSQNPF